MKNKGNENNEESGHGGMFNLEAISEKYFLMSSRHYRRLSRQGEVPAPVKGRIPFLEAIPMVVGHYKRLSEGKGIDALTEEKRQNVSLKNDILRFQKLVREGQLISKEEVVWGDVWRARAMKQELLLLDRTLVPQLIGKGPREMYDIVKSTTRRLLENYRRKYSPKQSIQKEIGGGDRDEEIKQDGTVS